MLITVRTVSVFPCPSHKGRGDVDYGKDSVDIALSPPAGGKGDVDYGKDSVCIPLPHLQGDRGFVPTHFEKGPDYSF